MKIAETWGVKEINNLLDRGWKIIKIDMGYKDNRDYNMTPWAILSMETLNVEQ